MGKLSRLFVIFLFLFVISLVEAQEITNPKLVKKLVGSYTNTGKIMIVNGEWYDLEVNLTIPQERPYQETSLKGNVTNSEGDKFLMFQVKNPPNPFEYSYMTDITTVERRTKTLPKSYDVPPEFEKYLEPTDKAQSNSTKIRELAEEITKDAVTDFEKIAKLALWVSENVEYDYSTLGEDRDALWVLENKRGLCIEHSNLFTALARSLGYPTKYVLGKAYGSFGWLGHSWNEVYLGRWVPVDPTWLEVGNLDATHIEFYSSKEGKLSNEVRANATINSQIEWPTDPFFGTNKKTGIKVNSVELNSKTENYEMGIGSEVIGLGEKTVVYLSMKSNEYKVIDAILVPCSSLSEIVNVEEQKKYLILEPGKTKVVSWVIASNPAIQKNVIYTCPLTLNSNYLKERVVSVKVRGDHHSPDMDISIEKPILLLGDDQRIDVSVSGASRVGLITDNLVIEKPVVDSHVSFLFKANRPGENKVIIYTSEGNAKKESFFVVEQAESYLESVTKPDLVMEGQNFTVTAKLKNASKRVKVTAIFDGQSKSTYVELDKINEVSFDFEAREAGDKTLQIIISDGITSGNTSKIKVLPPADANVGSVQFEKVDGSFITRINFITTPTVVNLSASLVNNSVSGSKQEVALSPGKHKFLLKWNDIFGNNYSKEVFVQIPEPPKSSSTSWFTLEDALIAIILAIVFVVLVSTATLLHLRIKRKKKHRRKKH